MGAWWRWSTVSRKISKKSFIDSMLVIKDLRDGPENLQFILKKKFVLIWKVCFIVSIEAILATIKTNQNYEKETTIHKARLD
jgi:hypothetical protein